MLKNAIIASINLNQELLTTLEERERVLFTATPLAPVLCFDSSYSININKMCSPICENVLSGLINSKENQDSILRELKNLWHCDSVCTCVCSPVCDAVCDGFL